MTSTQAPNPIDEVINDLISLIDWAATQPSRVGYFASLYLRVTKSIRSQIGTGYFDNDSRMESLDVTFASRYLNAIQQFRTHDPALPSAWAVALHATEFNHLIIVQHLLLSMNPHINIDLAISADQTSPGTSIDSLSGDFDKINAILASVVPDVISELGALSPYLHLISDLSEDGETSIIDFSLDHARDDSWTLAQKLAIVSTSVQRETLANLDATTAARGKSIVSPGLVASAVVDIIAAAEVKNIVQIIQALNAGSPLPLGPTKVFLPSTNTQTTAGNASTPGELTESVEFSGMHPSQIYYFEIAPGSWTGTFTFQITSWRILWTSSMSLKNKLLASAMQLFQSLFGDSSISCTLTPHASQGQMGAATNSFRIHKSWFLLWQSNEEYTLNPDGRRVLIDDHVNFGPIPSLFPEHDIYPAAVIDGGMRNIYHIKLLGTRFLGDYKVAPDKRNVRSTLRNDWALGIESLTKL